MDRTLVARSLCPDWLAENPGNTGILGGGRQEKGKTQMLSRAEKPKPLWRRVAAEFERGQTQRLSLTGSLVSDEA